MKARSIFNAKNPPQICPIHEHAQTSGRSERCKTCQATYDGRPERLTRDEVLNGGLYGTIRRVQPFGEVKEARVGGVSRDIYLARFSAPRTTGA
ncbi:hypothetical protein BaRGS_00002000 [Batillaria attramentaria]|uniref:Uncharacterized protein n=1 Tax=Batillaria attramentaria TaxID=370345 RepID=A0ABD0M3P4_9CAEN